jgi:hypothetical protein
MDGSFLGADEDHASEDSPPHPDANIAAVGKRQDATAECEDGEPNQVAVLDGLEGERVEARIVSTLLASLLSLYIRI